MAVTTKLMEREMMFDDELVEKSYTASLSVLKNIIPYICDDEGTAARLKKCVKDMPRLISTGNCKVVPSAQRPAILGEAVKACREIVVMLSYCRDLFDRFINMAFCGDLIKIYQSIEGELTRTFTDNHERTEVSCEEGVSDSDFVANGGLHTPK